MEPDFNKICEICAKLWASPLQVFICYVICWFVLGLVVSVIRDMFDTRREHELHRLLTWVTQQPNIGWVIERCLPPKRLWYRGLLFWKRLYGADEHHRRIYLLRIIATGHPEIQTVVSRRWYSKCEHQQFLIDLTEHGRVWLQNISPVLDGELAPTTETFHD